MDATLTFVCIPFVNVEKQRQSRRPCSEPSLQRCCCLCLCLGDHDHDHGSGYYYHRTTKENSDSWVREPSWLVSPSAEMTHGMRATPAARQRVLLGDAWGTAAGRALLLRHGNRSYQEVLQALTAADGLNVEARRALAADIPEMVDAHCLLLERRAPVRTIRFEAFRTAYNATVAKVFDFVAEHRPETITQPMEAVYRQLSQRQNVGSTRFRGKARHVLEKRAGPEAAASKITRERALLRQGLLHGQYGKTLKRLRSQLGYLSR